MAKTYSGILGRLSGAVANVVGGSWKGISYIRERVTPANPRTPAQTQNRLAMALITYWAKTLILPFLRPFIDRRTRKMSGINFITSRNYPIFAFIQGAQNITLTPNWGNSANFQLESRFQIARGSLPNFFQHSFVFEGGSFSMNFLLKPNISLLTNTDFLYIIYSDLYGEHPAYVQWVRLDNAMSSDPNIAALQQSNGVSVTAQPFGDILTIINESNRVLINVLTMRYNSPDRMDYPINISRDRNCVFDGSGVVAPPTNLLDTLLDGFSDNMWNILFNPSAPQNEGRAMLSLLNNAYFSALSSLNDIPLSATVEGVQQKLTGMQWARIMQTQNMQDDFTVGNFGYGWNMGFVLDPGYHGVSGLEWGVIIIQSLTNPALIAFDMGNSSSQVPLFGNILTGGTGINGIFTAGTSVWAKPEVAPIVAAGGKILVTMIALRGISASTPQDNTESYHCGVWCLNTSSLPS
jgi:hypothetical protein